VAAPETEITAVPSIPPDSFSYQAAAAPCNGVYNPVNLNLPPPMDKVAPASSVKTCFSFTADPKLRDSASSSTTPHRPMLKKPKLIAFLTTTSPTPGTNEDCEFTDDNFTGLPEPPFDSTATCSEPPMPFGIDGAL
jgi:hypothetical protein